MFKKLFQDTPQYYATGQEKCLPLFFIQMYNTCGSQKLFNDMWDAMKKKGIDLFTTLTNRHHLIEWLKVNLGEEK